MQRILSTLGIAVFFATLSFIGLAPTASADDCADACVEDCRVGVGVNVLAAQCDVGHQPTGFEGCYATPCGDYIVDCHALDRGQDPSCETAPVDTEVCVPIIRDGEFQMGVCSDVSSDCWAWTYNRFGTNCLMGRPVS